MHLHGNPGSIDEYFSFVGGEGKLCGRGFTRTSGKKFVTHSSMGTNVTVL